MTHLWEVDHSYYCSESNYYSNEPGMRFTSWQGFIEEWGGNDFDLNMVFRWDWQPKEFVEDDSPEGLRAYADRFGERDHAWVLQLFYILQRKGIFLCNEVEVCKADEPAVREFLAPRLRHLQELWSPIFGPGADL